MYVVSFKSEDTNIFIERDELVQILNRREDHSWTEVIPVRDGTLIVRVYFDIEVLSTTETASSLLNTIMTILNAEFKTSNDDWAIASCHRDNKLSFHILSRKYKISITILKTVVMKLLYNGCPGIDLTVYEATWGTPKVARLRLPWQSKKGAANGDAPPLLIESGTIEDFLITSSDNLTYLNPHPFLYARGAVSLV
jgi:hypothetical protein